MVALRLQVLAKSFTDRFRPRRLRIRLSGDPGIECGELIGGNAYRNRSGIHSGASAAAFQRF